MKLSVIIVISVLALSGGTCSAQQIANKDSLNPFTSGVESRGPFGRLAGDMLTQLTAVFHMSKESSMWVGAGVFLAGTLIATDQGTYNTIKRTRGNNSWMRKISPYISNLGSWYGVSVIGAFTGFGLLLHNQKALETSYLAAESFLTSGLWIRGLKALSGRERPSARNIFSHEAGGEWWGPLVEFTKRRNGRSVSSFDAFPSGHTASAFSIATVIANQYSSNLIVPVISYSLASLVGIARIVDDTHWASDVFVGAIIGYLTSKEVMLNNPSELSRKENSGIVSSGKAKSKNHLSYCINPFDKTLVFSYNF